ncbi:hypothetical protein PCASD_15870 [Puccinia coronata f. sp. avenae]|uniref:Uncharacterized protein n=1 Tax=Puccinia coronata f. sp. avenae TaxID=200324 RepID=A0A2N5U7T9_9BASI|nr:hypothetical protein PCASD_15870 [Puccinia coronata f. sp. avenae]
MSHPCGLLRKEEEPVSPRTMLADHGGSCLARMKTRGRYVSREYIIPPQWNNVLGGTDQTPADVEPGSWLKFFIETLQWEKAAKALPAIEAEENGY